MTTQKRNHPQKGSSIKVDPIRKEKDIKAIMDILDGNPRNYLLFTMGVNNGLRTGDLLRLRVRDVRYLKAGDTLTIREGKTKKNNVLVINKKVFKALKYFLDRLRPDDSDFLFKSRKKGEALTVSYINRLVKKWAKQINLKGNFGAHSLRKTWGYQQRVKFGVGYEVLAKRFNHDSPATTMLYLGIEDKEVVGVLMNEVG